MIAHLSGRRPINCISPIPSHQRGYSTMFTVIAGWDLGFSDSEAMVMLTAFQNKIAEVCGIPESILFDGKNRRQKSPPTAIEIQQTFADRYGRWYDQRSPFGGESHGG